MDELHKLTLILDEHQSKQCPQLARNLHLMHGVIMMGRGTMKASWLNLLGITSQAKEIIQFLVPAKESSNLLKQIATHLQLDTPHHGIAYTSPVETGKVDSSKMIKEEQFMYKKITVIIDRGLAEEVVDKAKEVGVTGGTIIHGRGTGSEVESKLFGVEIEPEKEIIFMLVPQHLVPSVIETLTKSFDLGALGKGILYVEPILETRGLFSATQPQ